MGADRRLTPTTARLAAGLHLETETMDDYTIETDGLWCYVIDCLSGERVSPPLGRADALAKRREIEALPAHERALLRASKRPAPGADWLIPRSTGAAS